MGITETAGNVISVFNDYAWYVAFVALIGLGLYFTLKLKGVQIRDAGRAYRIAFSRKKIGKSEHVTSFEAFCVGLGTRIGVGNIAGVATAIVAGGPGAIFWMWIFALIGAATSFMECVLGQIFKEKKSDGLYHGGPAYYIKNGLKMKHYAAILAIMVIALYGIGFIGVQSSNATNALVGAFDFDNNQLIFTIVITLAAAAVILGGIKRVATASAKIVPIMALAWLAFATVTVISNYVNIPNAFVMIFNGAFNLQSFVGGGMGAAIMMGLKRGVFSNEAGIGSIPNVASAADVPHPVKQGLIQSLSSLIDTFVICTATAFVVLTFGDFASIQAIGLNGAPLVQEILKHSVLGGIGPALLSIFMLFFAFTSIIGYYSMCEANTRFLTTKPWAEYFLRIMIIVVVFVSCMITLQLMWDLCDALMAIMAVLNMVAVLMLSKYAFEAYADYKAQLDKGVEEPVLDTAIFSGDVSGITCWNNGKA